MRAIIFGLLLGPLVVSGQSNHVDSLVRELESAKASYEPDYEKIILICQELNEADRKKARDEEVYHYLARAYFFKNNLPEQKKYTMKSLRKEKISGFRKKSYRSSRKRELHENLYSAYYQQAEYRKALKWIKKIEYTKLNSGCARGAGGNKVLQLERIIDCYLHLDKSKKTEKYKKKLEELF